MCTQSWPCTLREAEKRQQAAGLEGEKSSSSLRNLTMALGRQNTYPQKGSAPLESQSRHKLQRRPPVPFRHGTLVLLCMLALPDLRIPLTYSSPVPTAASAASLLSLPLPNSQGLGKLPGQPLTKAWETHKPETAQMSINRTRDK